MKSWRGYVSCKFFIRFPPLLDELRHVFRLCLRPGTCFCTSNLTHLGDTDFKLDNR